MYVVIQRSNDRYLVEPIFVAFKSGITRSIIEIFTSLNTINGGYFYEIYLNIKGFKTEIIILKHLSFHLYVHIIDP